MTAQSLIMPLTEGAELRRWALAAGIVFAVHSGVVAGYVLYVPDEMEGAAVAPAVLVDLSPTAAAPPSAADLAPGPEMPDAMPSPKPPPQAKPEVAEPIQKVEAPAEVTLPLPKPKAAEQKPKEEPDAQKTETETQQQEAPSVRTAPPRSERRVAVAPAAPRPGSAASRAAMASWRDLVVARLQQNKRYPTSAESRGHQGVVTLSFSVDRNGKVLSRSIAKSSGFEALDEEVLAMIARAQPLPAFPPAMTQTVMHLAVPIRFSLR